ncbi:hypothetical protein ACNHYB_09950 [Isoptericola jiangsuensis]|uniref:hypothetical protein n=1 Tax=Isoptericola jiangsuensis TaxID=548579 RepID=UPI003AAA617F
MRSGAGAVDGELDTVEQSLERPLDAERALFAGDVGDPVVAWGVLAAAITCAVGLVVGIRATRRLT